jgi:hypothetical protein
MVGAVVKLRRLCDEEVGMAVGESESELASLRQVFEFIERQAGGVPDETLNVLHPDPLAAAVSEALALRLLSRYRDARDTVEHYGGDVSALPAAPSFAEIDKRYMELMHDDVLGVPPDTASAELRYLDLIEAIIADQLLPNEGPVMSEEEDLNCALQMLKWVQAGQLPQYCRGYRQRAGKAEVRRQQRRLAAGPVNLREPHWRRGFLFVSAVTAASGRGKLSTG